MMQRQTIKHITAIILLAACSQQPVQEPDTSHAQAARQEALLPRAPVTTIKLSLEEKLRTILCDSNPECVIRDITNNDLAYGPWILKKLPLSGNKEILAEKQIYLHSGPLADGLYLKAGFIAFNKTDLPNYREVLEAVIATEGVVKDGKVLLEIAPLETKDQAVILMTGSFWDNKNDLIKALSD